MRQEIEQLLVIQDRDKKIKALTEELGTVPFERQRVEQTLSSKTAAFELAKQKQRDLEVQLKKLELDATARRESIAKFKTQQFQTRKNEEFQALGHEIERFESEIQKTEDQEIEIMEEVDRTQKEIRASEIEFKKIKSQTELQIGLLAKKQQTLQDEVRKIETEREELAKGVDPNLLFQYQRLFASKGGDAVVAVEHEVCMGCHMKNTTTTVHRVKLGRDLVNCEQCGRMLYYPD